MTNIPKRQISVDDINPAEAYKLGTGLIVPRPIGWIGTTDGNGNANLAPYSFFNMVSPSPPTFVFSPGLGPRKDTLANVQATGEFTVNLVTEETVEAMNATAAAVEADIDEFELAGLTAAPSETIGAPMVAEATVNFECVVTHIMPLGKPSGELPGSNMLVIGETTRIHIAERVIDDALNIDQVELKAIGRHVGGLYCRTAETLFKLDRPV